MEAQGLLWPSKLARILATDKPLLWIGPGRGAIAQSLRRRPLTACFEKDEMTLVADWIQQLSETPSKVSGSEPIRLENVRRLRNERCARFGEWIARLG